MDECGDGLRVDGSIECDDGNLVSGDGCDESCRLEPGFICQGGSPTSKDTCTQMVSLAIQSVALTPEFKLKVQLNEPVLFTRKTRLIQLEFTRSNLEIKKDASLIIEF